jgi:hypothetical protein
MRAGTALRLALRDCYVNSWRLVLVNGALGLVLAVTVFLAVVWRPALVLVVLAGPLAASLVHCSVTLVREGNLTFADAFAGFRLHWRRSLQLAAAGLVLVLFAIVALRVYSGSPLLWPLAFAAAYVAVLLGIYQVVLWTLAIAEPNRSLRASLREAAVLVARKPGSTFRLGLALLFLNAVGITAAVMPFLTLTIAYSFVAAAHFALPAPTPEERS